MAGFKRKRNAITVHIGGKDATKKGLEAARKAGKPYPEIEAAVDTATLKNHEPFKDLGTPPNNDAEIKQRVIEIRERMLCSIAVIKKEFPQEGLILEGVWKSRGFCFDFPFKKKKKSSSSGLKTKKGKIRINLVKFPQNPASNGDDIYDEEGFKFISELLMQACMAKVETGTVKPKKAKEARLQAQVDKLCGLELVLTKEVQWLTEYKRILKSIISTDALPADAKGIGCALGRELLKDPDLSNATNRAVKAGLIHARVCSRLAKKTTDLNKTKTEKQSLTQQSALLLEERPDGYYANLRGAHWMSEEMISTDGTPHLISGGGGIFVGENFLPVPSFQIISYPVDGSDPVAHQVPVFGVDVITGAEYDPDRGYLIMSGYGATGGRIIFMEDTDGDLIPDGSLMFPPNSMGLTMGGVLKIPPDAEPGEIFVLDRATREIYHGTDPDQGDEFRYPGSFSHIGTMASCVRPAREMICSDDRLEICTTDGNGAGDYLIEPNEPQACSRRPNLASHFAPAGKVDFFLRAVFDPEIDLPMAGAKLLGFNAMPYRNYQLFHEPTGGGESVLMDERSAGPTGTGTFVFPDHALVAGDSLKVVDVSDPEEPLIEEEVAIFISGDFGELTLGDGGDPNLLMEIRGRSNQRWDILDSSDPGSFDGPPGISVGLDGFGKGFATVNLQGTRRFYRGVESVIDLARFENEIITVNPGDLTNIDLALLAGFTPETKPNDLGFQLVSAPPEFAGPFFWHGNGEISVNLTSNSKGYNFSYNIISPNGDISEDYEFFIQTGDDSFFCDPPTYIDEFGIEWASVVVLILEDDRYYPVKQFDPWNGGGDLLCLSPHWHGHDVRSLELPEGPGRDEIHGSCGFGLIFPFFHPQAPTVPVTNFDMPVGLWDDWNDAVFGKGK